jgi:hypothetical protein
VIELCLNVEKKFAPKLLPKKTFHFSISAEFFLLKDFHASIFETMLSSFFCGLRKNFFYEFLKAILNNASNTKNSTSFVTTRLILTENSCHNG